jgi:hypothetical protein
MPYGRFVVYTYSGDASRNAAADMKVVSSVLGDYAWLESAQQ